jgi:hypothetical protein
MKTMSIIFLIVVLSSCQDKPNFNGPVEKVRGTPESKKDADLIGQWWINVTGDGGVAGYCNVCPRVSFYINGTGRITFPGGSVQDIGWERKDLRLEIVNASEREIDAGEYVMSFERKPESVTLRLNKVGGSRFHVLSRGD